MTDSVQITLIICITIIISIWMTRSTVMHLAKAEKENFTFIVKLFKSAGMWLFRGSHSPSKYILPDDEDKAA